MRTVERRIEYEGRGTWFTFYNLTDIHGGSVHCAEKKLDKIIAEIKDDPQRRALLVNDLTALYSAKLIARTPIEGKGPRGLDLAPDGKQLAAAMYFSGSVVFLDARTGKITRTVPQARKEAAPTRGHCATAISDHEAAKYLNAAKYILYQTIFEQKHRTA